MSIFTCNAMRPGGHVHKEWRKVFLLLLVSLWSGSVPATPPIAGELISNRAEAVYYHEVLAGYETVYSNTTVVEVAPIRAVILQPEQERRGAPGVTVVMPHRLSNIGNVNVNVVINYQNQIDDDYDLNSLRFVIDLDNDGVFDAREPVLASNDTLPLAVGEHVNILLLATVPASAPDRSAADVVIDLQDEQGQSLFTLTDRVFTELNAGAVLQSSKAASLSTAQPDDVINYRLTGTNVGLSELEAIDILINNTSDRKVVIKDYIPRGAQFKTITSSGAGQPLYHRVGATEHSYQSVPPVDYGQIDAVAFAFDPIVAGQSYAVGFSVQVNANAGGEIRNTAMTYYQTGGVLDQVATNEVITTLPAAPASLNYYQSGNQSDVLTVAHIGDRLNLVANVSQCNVNPAVVEEYRVILSTQASQDYESQAFVRETGPNTGIFILTEISTLQWPVVAKVVENGSLEVARNDVVTARLESCAGVTLETKILIDPAGIVFNPRNNQPVAGAVVTLVGVLPNGSIFIPVVRNIDGSVAPGTVTTGADGLYEFPLVNAGNYQVIITPPNGFSFPSDFSVPLMNPARRINTPGSFGGTFEVSVATGPVFLDIPVDPSFLGGLFIEKVANQAVAGIGDAITYTVRIMNNTGIDIFDITVQDTLPTGFAYMKGSSRLDKEEHDEPAGAPGPDLVYDVGYVEAGESKILSYRAQIRTGAIGGEGVNIAQAFSTDAISNISTATVKIQDQIFSPEGIIAGKVFVDCNLNRMQDPEDLGIPGVRLFLEDGTWVISDAEGKYSFAGVRATTHVLKVDKTTLPEGSELTTLSNRNAGVTDSQFIDLKRGELFRADVAEGSCTDDIVVQVKARRENGAVFIAETEQRLSETLRTDNQQISIDPRSRPSSGVLGSNGGIQEYKPLVGPSRLSQKTSNLSEVPHHVGANLNLDLLIREMTNELGFVDLKDGDTLASDQVSIRVKGMHQTIFTLQVNGKQVAEKRIGQRTILADKQVQAWEYVAVTLQVGENELKLVQTDPFGITRGEQTITVIAPGRLGHLKINIAGKGAASADGKTPVPVLIGLFDDNDVAVSARTSITLESELGWWDAHDLDPVEPGLQVFIEGGDAMFDLLPPDVPGTTVVRVTSGVLKAEQSVDFLPDLRPLIVAGVIDGAVGFNKLKESELTPAAKDDGFEEQIGDFSFSHKGDSAFGARTALFLKGKVRGDHLLTLSYDSDKDLKDRLFRDIRPDEFYAVYGDSAVKGFDAQSTGKLYLRIDKGRSYMLYGDYTTQSTIEARKLGNYNRSLNGARFHHESDRVSMNIFAAYDSSQQIVKEIPARGISGPYALSDSNLLINSEKVEIITRDRNQPAIIIDTIASTRYTDYSFDPLANAILFRRPVPSFDVNLNPVFIRVSYESEQSISSFWQYGADGQVKLGRFLELGASAVGDENPGNEYELYSANVTVKLSDASHVIIESAQSNKEQSGSGSAHRIELQHEGDKLSGRVYGYQSDAQFDNPNASISPGRNEFGVKSTYRVSTKTQLSGEYIYTEDRSTEGERKGALVSVERRLGNDLRAQIGLRHSTESVTAAQDTSAGTTPRETTSVRVRSDWQLTQVDGASLFAEYEQDVRNSERKTATVGGEYQLADRGRAYLRHEFISSLSGVYGLSELAKSNHNTVIGFDFNYLDSQNVFSEYRMRDAISGRDAEAAFGLRNSWTVSEGLRVNGSFERVMPLQGSTRETTAITGAFEYTGSELWKSTGRLELRQSDTDRTALNTLGVARKLNRQWTFLSQNALNVREQRETGLRTYDNRLRTGLAFRENDQNRINALARYEFKYEEDEALNEQRTAHIWSANVNYKPNRPFVLSGRYAGKWIRQRGLGLRNDFSAHLLSTRMTYDVTERWDVGLYGSTLFDGDSETNRYGLGIEAGVLLTSNLWLSAGYNVFGYKDDDFAGDEYTNSGVYTRFRFKFSEDMFEWLK